MKKSQRKPNQYGETLKYILRKRSTSSGKEFFCEHKEEKELFKTHSVSNSKVICYTRLDAPKQIIVERDIVIKDVDKPYDLKRITHKIVDPYGWSFEHKTLRYFFSKHISNIEKVIIGDYKKPIQNGKTLRLSADKLAHVISELNVQKRANTDTNNAILENFWKESFPKLGIKIRKTNNNKQLVLKNLNDRLMGQLNAGDVEKFGEFYINATKKFKRSDLVQQMMLNLQKNSQLLSLQEIIKQFDNLIESNPVESKWQTFFEENITLFDNRYIRKLDQKNIATGITKYPDLILVDIYGYIDFYELKRSGMKLLTKDKNRKNYYWSSDMAKSIAQVSDYLQKVKENSASFSKAIKEETSYGEGEGLTVNVINPRGIIVAGKHSSLTNEKMKGQFKNLRESMKDIEFLLYDEMLDRLKNLLQNVIVR